ncbi:hypothetical protein CVIRNUC_009984 [Coccomyxa viridis]|uniref:Secreted protein n=1 Tax=Coccomyxa viridis TaxID=1274662 RepID=A0AAV1IL47_9CHLO|nr:hypothetical protein CVIRNUC_009984 [Coccomyxa viridis]
MLILICGGWGKWIAATLHYNSVYAPEGRAASASSSGGLKTRISKRRRQGRLDTVRARPTVIPLHQEASYQ